MFDLTRRNPNLDRLIESVFPVFTDDFFTRLGPQNTFKVDVSEEEDRYLVEAELPGVSKDDVKLSIEQNRLIISGTRSSSREVKDDRRGTLLRERSCGSFSRAIPFIDNIDPALVSAKLEDGILRIEIPKTGGGDYNRIEIQ